MEEKDWNFKIYNPFTMLLGFIYRIVIRDLGEFFKGVKMILELDVGEKPKPKPKKENIWEKVK
tara:strand:+ start:233 stop:421 length:189 start_codon:yes stop_codon:yes gene_type:complete